MCLCERNRTSKSKKESGSKNRQSICGGPQINNCMGNPALLMCYALRHSTTGGQPMPGIPKNDPDR